MDSCKYRSIRREMKGTMKFLEQFVCLTSRIIESKLSKDIEGKLGEEQAAFRKDV